MPSTDWMMILIGCAGGLIPDALRIIKNRPDPKVPEYLRSVTFWIGLLLLVILGRLAAWLGEAAKRSRREAKDEFFEFLIYFFTVADGDDDYKELFFFDPVYDSIVGCPQRTQAG